MASQSSECVFVCFSYKTCARKQKGDAITRLEWEHACFFVYMCAYVCICVRVFAALGGKKQFIITLKMIYTLHSFLWTHIYTHNHHVDANIHKSMLFV